MIQTTGSKWRHVWQPVTHCCYRLAATGGQRQTGERETELQELSGGVRVRDERPAMQSTRALHHSRGKA